MKKKFFLSALIFLGLSLNSAVVQGQESGGTSKATVKVTVTDNSKKNIDASDSKDNINTNNNSASSKKFLPQTNETNLPLYTVLGSFILGTTYIFYLKRKHNLSK